MTLKLGLMAQGTNAKEVNLMRVICHCHQVQANVQYTYSGRACTFNIIGLDKKNSIFDVDPALP